MWRFSWEPLRYRLPMSASEGGNSEKESSPTAFAWQANIGFRVFKSRSIRALIELPLSSVPSQQFNFKNVNPAFPGASTGGSGSPDSAYLFTPGLRFQFGNRKISPYSVVGFGFEHASQLNVMPIGTTGALLSLSRSYNGAFDVGGGFDIGLHRHFAFRTEFRDYIRTGKFVSVSRNNLVLMGGGVLRF